MKSDVQQNWLPKGTSWKLSMHEFSQFKKDIRQISQANSKSFKKYNADIIWGKISRI